MSRLYVFIVAIALACSMSAGTANAIPFHHREDISSLFKTSGPERETPTFGPGRMQFGSLPILFQSPFQYSPWFGPSEQRWGSMGLRVAGFFGGFYGEYGRPLHESFRGFWRGGRNLIFFIWSEEHHHHASEPGAPGNGSSVESDPPAPTPIPAPLVLLGSGLGLIGFFARRRKQAVVAA